MTAPKPRPHGPLNTGNPFRNWNQWNWNQCQRVYSNQRHAPITGEEYGHPGSTNARLLAEVARLQQENRRLRGDEQAPGYRNRSLSGSRTMERLSASSMRS